MKLDKKLTAAMSEQVVAEYYSAYLYLSMSAYCDLIGLKGFANWMHVQAQEELAHGTHLFEYLLERGAEPQLGSIAAPPQTFDDIEDVFAKSLLHEQKVSESINRIASIAMKENDHAAYAFIMWYVQEQVEEEATAGDILQKLRFLSGDPAMTMALDTELGARVFVDPFAGVAG